MRVAIVFLFVLQACSTLDSSPFEKFSKSTVELNRATETVLTDAIKQVREEEIQTISEDLDSKLGPFHLKTQGQTWDLNPKPRYMQIASVQADLKEMNKSFERYLELILALSGSKITNPQDLVSSVKKINHPEYGLISAAAVKSFESFMKSKQEKHLRKAIKANQSSVAAFSKQASELVQLINEKYRTSYELSFKKYSKNWKKGNRSAILRDVFDLNDTFIQDMSRFNHIIAGYEQLPIQHLNLAKKKPNQSLMVRLKELSEEIKSAQKMKSEIESEKK